MGFNVSEIDLAMKDIQPITFSIYRDTEYKKVLLM